MRQQSTVDDSGFRQQSTDPRQQSTNRSVDNLGPLLPISVTKVRTRLPCAVKPLTMQKLGSYFGDAHDCYLLATSDQVGRGGAVLGPL